MRVLAIDTALAACSAAVLDTERGAVTAQEQLAMQRGHAEALMPLVARVMERAKLAFAALDRIAVTVGPGSFTGLRVGISAARGIALAAGKPAVGLIDARRLRRALHRRRRYASRWWRRSMRGTTTSICRCLGRGGRTLVAPRLASLRDALARLRNRRAAHHRHRGQSHRRRLAGRRAAAGRGRERAAPDIGWVARLGAAAVDDGPPPKPLYLRAPDAQPQDAAQLARR